MGHRPPQAKYPVTDRRIPTEDAVTEEKNKPNKSSYMKKNVIMMLLALTPLLADAAGPARDGVAVRGLRVWVDGDSLRMNFRVQLGGNASGGRDYKLTLRPVLAGGGSEQSLRPIEVYGRRVEILDARSARPRVKDLEANDLRNPAPGALHAVDGTTVDYAASLALEKWMEGAGLRMERERSGCCRTERLPEVVLASEVVETPTVNTAPLLARVEAMAQTPVVITTGDSLSRAYSFVEPASALEARKAQAKPAGGGLFDLDMPLNMGKGMEPARQSEVEEFIAAGEEGALKVHFPQGKSDIRRYFRDNNVSLVNLVSGIRAIEESKTSRVTRVVIVGSASPEGTLAFNDRLAWSRAVSLKEFIERNTKLKGDAIRLFNGSEDWRGLRELVAASDMYEKNEILHIIDNVPITKGRESELMKLGGGRPYLYMLEHMFPELRNAAFIKVYYENVPDKAAEALAEGAALVAAGKYAEALETLKGAPAGTRRDFLQGVSLYFTGHEEEALPWLERAARGGEQEAAQLLEELTREAAPRTFEDVLLPMK